MDALYVCLFSNGHIKVGRSINPDSRIASHADRLSVAGIELADRFVVQCPGRAFPRETMLIERCAANCEKRHKDEWFVGLDFAVVCAWARELAEADIEHCRDTRWSKLIADLRKLGWTQTDIATSCECGQATISRLALGQQAEPMFSMGMQLLAIHADAMAKAGQRRVEGADPSGFDLLNSHGLKHGCASPATPLN